MKSRAIVFLLAATVTTYGGAPCAAIGQIGGGASEGNTFDITQAWKFRTGDDPGWSQVACDDSAWDDIGLATPWEERDHAGYDGYAWYRTRLQVPAHYKESADFRQCRRLMLSLGWIDAEVEVWFNGKPVDLNPVGAERWRARRVYEIPEELVQWGAANLVAMRVYDSKGKGTTWREEATLSVANWRQLVSIDIGTRKENGIFPDGEWLQVHAVIENRTFTKIKGNLVWKVETDEQEQLKDTSIPFTLDAGQKIQAYCPLIELPESGFYRVTCTFEGGSADGTLSDSMTVGYAPSRIDQALTRAPDFDEFWQTALRELREVDPQYKLIRQEKESDEKRDLYLVEMQSQGGLTVRGWYEVPNKPGKHPALLRVPGYRSSMRPVNKFDDMVILSINIRSHGNSDEAPGAPSDLWVRGLDNEAEYYYRGAYLDCIRAVDFLASRSEVDSKRIAVWGSSQGGGLSLVTAALDQRISLCVADVPWLCDWVKFFKTTHWDEIDAWLAADTDRSWTKMLRTLSYFDAMNMVDRIECPVFMAVGLQDRVCPPATSFASFNKIRSPKEYRVYPDAGHRLGSEHWESGFERLRKSFGLDR